MLTDADQLQLSYTAKTNAAVRHVLAELARVQAERDGLRLWLVEALDGWEEYAEATHRYNEGEEWPEAQMVRIASIRKEAGL